MTKNEAKRNYLEKGIITKEVFEKFLNEDPTPQKKYVFYMLKEYLKQIKEEGGVDNNITIDDLDMGVLSPIFSYVTEFNTLIQSVPQDKKDIYKLTFQELTSIVDELNNPGEGDDDDDKESLRQRARENSDNFNEMGLIDIPGVSVVAPYNHDAICYYGQGSTWCVSMDTPGHWMSYYFNQNNTFYIITITGKNVKDRIREKYLNKWKSMGFGRARTNGNFKWTLLKNGRDIAHIMAPSIGEAAEKFKKNFKLDNLDDYTIENYGYRNLFKVAFLIPPKKDKNGNVIHDEEGNPVGDIDKAHVYSTDDISGWNWKEYFKLIGLDDYI